MAYAGSGLVCTNNYIPEESSTDYVFDFEQQRAWKVFTDRSISTELRNPVATEIAINEWIPGSADDLIEIYDNSAIYDHSGKPIGKLPYSSLVVHGTLDHKSITLTLTSSVKHFRSAEFSTSYVRTELKLDDGDDEWDCGGKQDVLLKFGQTRGE